MLTFVALESLAWARGVVREDQGLLWTAPGGAGASAGPGSDDLLFSPLQATDNDVGTFGEVSYFFSDDPDR